MHTVPPVMCTLGIMALALNAFLVVCVLALLVWHQAKVQAVFKIVKMLARQKQPQTNSPNDTNAQRITEEQEQSDDEEEGLPPAEIVAGDKKNA